MDRQSWEAVVRKGEFGKWEAEDESSQRNRLRFLQLLLSRTLLVPESQNPLLILDREDSC